METPFGEIAVLDAHSHFFSHRFFATLAKELAGSLPEQQAVTALKERLPFEFPDPDPVSLGKRWVQELDRQGVSRTVLIASVPGDEESVAAAARAFPDRILPYFMLNPTEEDAPRRVERAFAELGFKGVCLFPAMHRFRVWDRRLFTIYEKVSARGGIVFVHCGHLKVGIRDKLGLPSRFDMRFSNPVELDGVARAFPQLPFVLPHFGCGYFREFLLLADQCENIYTDTSSSNGWMRLMPYPLDLKSVYAKALEVLGPERILFGTDSSFFPRGWRRDIFDTQVRVLSDLGVSRLQAAQILGENLARLTGG
ncbi:MAG TPA: amidohydrolase family protein [Vicinamibacteria bacterium]|nr:amidohydrolase family protein [Vicinamibacteria bacterium]